MWAWTKQRKESSTVVLKDPFQFQIDWFRHPKDSTAHYLWRRPAEASHSRFQPPSLFVIHQPNKLTRCVIAFWVNQTNYHIPIVSLMNSAVWEATKKRSLSHDRKGRVGGSGRGSYCRVTFTPNFSFQEVAPNLFSLLYFPTTHPSMPNCLFLIKK